jgi:putative Ca2+/H+ antiporter (TMEM165/GDT1 family)
MKFAAAVIHTIVLSSDSTTHPAQNSSAAKRETALEAEAPTVPTSEVVQEPTPVQQKQGEKTNAGFWRVFFSTFGTIFLAEIGDKTQVTTLLMSAESHSPWTVFAGAGTALIATSLLGVLLGQWLSKRIKPATLDRAAGVTLLVIMGWLVWDIGGF